MFQNIIIGQYVRGCSLLHRMDPRAKIISVFILGVIIFLANNWQSFAAIIFLVLFTVLLSRVSIRFIYKGLKPILLLVLITFILHLVITREGAILFTIGPFSIYETGFMSGILIAFRLLSLVVIASLLTLTTTPIELTDGLESMLAPLKKIGVPAHEFSLMMSIALRFIPTLLQETEKVLKAQMARGVDFTAGSIASRMKAVIPMLIPLFISAFKRAEDLAYAMEARGYRGGEGRTSLREMKWSVRDTWLLLIVGILSYTIILLRT